MYVYKILGSTFRDRSRYNDWPRAGRYGDRIPVGARFPALLQTGPGTHAPSYTLVPAVFPGGKAAGPWCWPPTSAIAKVNERVELYTYIIYAVQQDTQSALMSEFIHHLC